MPTARIAASGLPARLRNGPITAVAAAKKSSMRRPRCWSTTAAAARPSPTAATVPNTCHGTDGSRLRGSSRYCAGTNNGYAAASLLPSTLARLSVHGGQQSRQRQSIPVGPRQALAWAAGGSGRVNSSGGGIAARFSTVTPAATSTSDGRSPTSADTKVAAAPPAGPAASDNPLSGPSPSPGGGGGGNGSGVDRGVSTTGNGDGLLRAGTLWQEKAAKEAQRWLQQRLALSEQQSAKILVAAPLFFQGGSRPTGSPVDASAIDATVLERRVNWLEGRLGLDKKGIRKVVRGYPRIFSASVEADLEPRLVWLKERLGLTPAAIRKLVVSFPTLFNKNVKDGLGTKLTWLERRLGMNPEELSKMVVKFPTLLSYSVHDNLEPRIRWLEERLGLDDDGVRKMVLQFPAVFGYSIEDNLEPKLSWLQSQLGLDLEGSRRLVRLAPPILGASIDDNLRHKVSRMQEILEMSREEVVALLIRKPALLALDADNNLEPTVRFFQEEMGARRRDVREALGNNSSLLTYSLGRRWRPRLARMRRLKVQPLFSEHWRPMATLGDQSFGLWVKKQSSLL